METDHNARGVWWLLGSALWWLVLGTTIGEYLGMKFVAPDMDAMPWLGFGRLRPVHTNMVFWGWASMGMLGLAHYVLPRVCGVDRRHDRSLYWVAGAINLAVTLGTLCLMAGINNGGGEYREYIWPVMAVFAAGILISLRSAWITVRMRATAEIPVSAWYIISAHIFVCVIAFMAYQPFWQEGIAETIMQGYYMHQGVGMWFMMCTLGLFYYFIPRETGNQVLSEKLGKVAFWSQIVFYTVIGTHHFVFSSIPWWLQVVAILGSVGMVIPVIAGTVNFLSCYRGQWKTIGRAAPLVFLATAVVFYVTGSLQGTLEAFEYTNLMWHFTDFSVAHSHLTMYGIITFALWGGIYSVMGSEQTSPRPRRRMIHIHFWLALVGLLVYTVPLMIGGSMRGQSWMQGAPFIDSITLMVPFWTWRAIGGSLMWLSHLVVAYNWVKGGRHALAH